MYVSIAETKLKTVKKILLHPYCCICVSYLLFHVHSSVREESHHNRFDDSYDDSSIEIFFIRDFANSVIMKLKICA